MLTTTRYIIVYRDSPSDCNRYFGPYVNETLAYGFADELPKPLEGGYKYVKALAPYNSDEATLAHDVIMRRRVDGDPLMKTINEIVKCVPRRQPEITH